MVKSLARNEINHVFHFLLIIIIFLGLLFLKWLRLIKKLWLLIVKLKWLRLINKLWLLIVKLNFIILHIVVNVVDVFEKNVPLKLA